MSLTKHDSLAMLKALTDQLGATVSIYDRDLIVHYTNESFASWFNLPAAQLVGRYLPDLYGETVFAGYKPYIDRALAGEAVNYERLIRTPVGEAYWRTVSLVPWRNDAGEVIGVINSALSVHELKTTSEALRVANQKLTGHIHNSPLAVIELTPELNLVAWSERAQAIFGYTEAELGDDPLKLLLLDAEESLGESPLRLAFKYLKQSGAHNSRTEATHRRKDGSIVHCEWFNSALTDEHGRVTSIMSLVQDVSARVQAAEHLRYIAEHDSLTGLPNRAALHHRVDRALRRARRTYESVALLFIDLDGFKSVNDNYGHAAGDRVLIEAARRISLNIRKTDTLARLGGDEFVVLLEGQIDDEAPHKISNAIIAAFSTWFVFNVEHSTGHTMEVSVKVGASIGIAKHPPLESHVESLFKRADGAMYAAKRAGKGCVREADEPPA